MKRIRIIGPGRAGRSFALALEAAGIGVDLVGRGTNLGGLAIGVDAVLIATPDRVIAEVAAAIEPADAVVLHCSGASTLEVLRPHRRRGSVHPLMALPDSEIGAERLSGGGWFAVAGDPLAGSIVTLLRGRSFEVAEADRTTYHATASISANHLVVLLAQVERLAELVNVPISAFFDLARGSFDDVVAKGAVAALTGPASRGDIATLTAHHRALPPAERTLYDALAEAATELARHRAPGVPEPDTQGE